MLSVRCPSAKPDFTADPIEDVVVEIFWDAVTLSNSELYAAIVGAGEQWIAQVAGPSPLRIPLSGEAVDGLDAFEVRISVEGGEPAGYAVAQQFDAYTSVFLNEPAPADYTFGPN